MRLSNFIRENFERILREWEIFAATLVPSDQKISRVLLRDHVKQMLETIALDLDTPQSAHEAAEKSKGQVDSPPEEPTAASTHGIERLALGFSLNAAMAEYRALRASVTRLWLEQLNDQPQAQTVVDDLIRFNEAIDQAINESVTSYSFEKDQQTRVFDTILSSSPDLIFTFDLDGRFTYANKTLIDLFELPLEQIVGEKNFGLTLTNAAILQGEIEQVTITKKRFRGEIFFTNATGKQEFYECILVPVFNKEGVVEATAGTARNVTERKAAEDQNWQKANYDILTGLANRRLFNDRLERDLKYAQRTGAQLGLLFIDLDHFKAANDDFGHDTGDFLLRLAADRIRLCVRETDTVARMGGDEFTVILQDLIGSGQAELIARKILRELANSFQIFNHSIHISSSIGIAIFPKDATTPDQLLKHADQAMYVAKNAGRNGLSFYAPE